MRGGEIFFVPDRRWYPEAFRLIPRGSVVLDAGAGDLRFSLAIATKAKRVYAVEINPKVLGPALDVIGYDLPPGVIPICADVFEWSVPEEVNCIVCLMIHRQHTFPVSWRTRKIIHAEFKGLKVRNPEGKRETSNG